MNEHTYEQNKKNIKNQDDRKCMSECKKNGKCLKHTNEVSFNHLTPGGRDA